MTATPRPRSNEKTLFPWVLRRKRHQCSYYLASTDEIQLNAFLVVFLYSELPHSPGGEKFEWFWLRGHGGVAKEEEMGAALCSSRPSPQSYGTSLKHSQCVPAPEPSPVPSYLLGSDFLSHGLVLASLYHLSISLLIYLCVYYLYSFNRAHPFGGEESWLVHTESPDCRTRLAHSRDSKQICGLTMLFTDSHSSVLLPEIQGVWVNQKGPGFWVWITSQAHRKNRRDPWAET